MRAVEEVTGSKVPFMMGPRRPGDPPVLVANSERLQRALAWTPAYTDIREIVKTALEFQRQLNSRG
jgi:UDP-glucose 4-epimerase